MRDAELAPAHATKSASDRVEKLRCRRSLTIRDAAPRPVQPAGPMATPSDPARGGYGVASHDVPRGADRRAPVRRAVRLGGTQRARPPALGSRELAARVACDILTTCSRTSIRLLRGVGAPSTWPRSRSRCVPWSRRESSQHEHAAARRAARLVSRRVVHVPRAMRRLPRHGDVHGREHPRPAPHRPKRELRGRSAQGGVRRSRCPELL